MNNLLKNESLSSLLKNESWNSLLKNESWNSLNNTLHLGDTSINQMHVKDIIKLSVHCIVFAIASTGNVLLALVILRCLKTHNCATNWLILNLAVTDLCLIVINIPLSNIYHFTSWPFGEFLCKYVLGSFGECIVGVSILTHTALGLVRHQIVLNPMESKIRFRHVCIGIAFTWLVSYASLSAPINGKFSLVHSSKVKGFVCKPIWPSLQYKLVYRGCAFVITYLIPVIIASYCYVKIFQALKRSIRFLAKSKSATLTQMKKREYKSKRLSKALYIIYAIFALTTLPLEIFYVLADLKLLPRTNSMAHVWSMLLALFYSLSVVNPLMLFYMSEDYRNQLNLVVTCCCRKRRKTAGSMKSTRPVTNTSPFITRRDSRKLAQRAKRMENEHVDLKKIHLGVPNEKNMPCTELGKERLLQGYAKETPV
eukprot:gene9050-10016_t